MTGSNAILCPRLDSERFWHATIKPVDWRHEKPPRQKPLRSFRPNGVELNRFAAGTGAGPRLPPGTIILTTTVTWAGIRWWSAVLHAVNTTAGSARPCRRPLDTSVDVTDTTSADIPAPRLERESE
jgi:hypothetical protein